jgi:thymidylate synthase
VDRLPFDTIDGVQTWVLRALLEHGTTAEPRGLRVLELYPASFELRNPRNRLITNSRRKWSLPLALGEFSWHVSGSNEVEFIEYYASRWRDFAENETISGSCYGHRIFNHNDSSKSQWQQVTEILQTDVDSRRAVLLFHEPAMLTDPNAKDVPCATTLQFLVRDNKLHAFTHMRSNDAIWGLPYDVFLFTMLQELMALELDVQLGTYSHSVTSLHLYERHFSLARKVIAEDAPAFGMPPMERQDELFEFLKFERRIRKGEALISLTEAKKLSRYWYTLLQVLDSYRVSKLGQVQTPDYLTRYCEITNEARKNEIVSAANALNSPKTSQFF